MRSINEDKEVFTNLEAAEMQLSPKLMRGRFSKPQVIKEKRTNMKTQKYHCN